MDCSFTNFRLAFYFTQGDTMKKFFLITLFVFLTTSCSKNVRPDFDHGQSQKITTMDTLFEDVAQKLPGFGGSYFDKKGTLNVYIKGLSQDKTPKYILKAKLVKTLANVFKEDIFKNSKKSKKTRVNLIEGKYDVLELQQWRSLIHTSGNKYLVGTDFDENRNKVGLGILNIKNKDEVLVATEKLGVPKEAIFIFEAQPSQPELTLDQKNRPVSGGVKVAIARNNNYFGNCTAGFNVTINGKRGVMTNSHCTEKPGVVENHGIYQPTDGNHIGKESMDPIWWLTGGLCQPADYKCRLSDSAFFEYDSSTGSVNSMPRTTTTNQGSLVVNPALGRFKIVDVNFSLFNNASVGFLVNKLGAVTGHVTATIAQTCFTETQPYTDPNAAKVRAVCSNRAIKNVSSATSSAGGDSGSPIFEVISGNEVRLLGIHWGGSPVSGTFSYSPMANVSVDFSNLSNMTFPLPTPPPTTPSPPTTIEQCYEECRIYQAGECLLLGNTPRQCVQEARTCRMECEAN